MTLTLGELVVRRKLEKDGNRYTPGQENAQLVAEDTCLLTWVDTAGAACIAYCTYVKTDDEWLTHPQLVRAGFDFIELRNVPRAFATSESRTRLIQEAQKRKRRPSSGSKRKADAPDGGEERGSTPA